MKRLLTTLLCLIYFVTLQAQEIEYETLLQLKPGEHIDMLRSCWWPNEKKQIPLIVIKQSDNNYTVVQNGVRKENVPYEQLPTVKCKDLDPSKVPAESQYNSQFAHMISGTQWNIKIGKTNLGTYDKIYFMRELPNKFVAAVLSKKNGKEQVYYITSEGEKTPLDSRPETMVTNADLSRVAIVLAPKDNANTPPMEVVNKMPREKQIEFFEKMNANKTRSVWFNDGSNTDNTFTVDKRSKLLFDASGRHFIEIRSTSFFIDGKGVNQNISGAGTQVFVSEDGSRWAYNSIDRWLGFSDIKMAFKSSFSPFMTRENGQDYINWFTTQDEKNGTTTLKSAKRAF